MKWQTTVVTTVFVFVYAVLGGVGFHYLEKDNEGRVRAEVVGNIADFLSNHSCADVNDIIFIQKLAGRMFEGGLQISSGNDSRIINNTRWDYQTSIFVAIQLIATVGYKLAAPKSVGGRVLTIVFASVGIPLFAITAIAIGQLLNFIAEVVIRLLARCRRLCRRQSSGEDDERPVLSRLARRRGHAHRIVVVAVSGSVLFVIIPSVIFSYIENWTFGQAVYFCMITLLTIGFGDVVPGYGVDGDWPYVGWYRLAVGCWLVIQLGWIAGITTAIWKAVGDLTSVAEQDAIAKVDEFIQLPPPPPDIVVNQVGKTSVVSVLAANPKKKKRNKKAAKGLKPGKIVIATGDTTNVAVRSQKPITAADGRSSNAVAIGSEAPSYTSNVKIGLS
jgi:hypothetical protein